MQQNTKIQISRQKQGLTDTERGRGKGYRGLPLDILRIQGLPSELFGGVTASRQQGSVEDDANDASSVTDDPVVVGCGCVIEIAGSKGGGWLKGETAQSDLLHEDAMQVKQPVDHRGSLGFDLSWSRGSLRHCMLRPGTTETCLCCHWERHRQVAEVRQNGLKQDHLQSIGPQSAKVYANGMATDIIYQQMVRKS